MNTPEKNSLHGCRITIINRLVKLNIPENMPCEAVSLTFSLTPQTFPTVLSILEMKLNPSVLLILNLSYPNKTWTPARYFLLMRFIALNTIHTEFEKSSLIDYLSKDTWIFLKDHARIEDRANKILNNITNNGTLFTYNEIIRQFIPFVKITLSTLPLTSNNGDFTFPR